MTKRRKIVLILIAAVPIFLLNGYFALQYVRIYLGNYLWFGTLTNPAKRAANQGVPIAMAIEEFKHDTGLYPQYLHDLVPKYLKKSPSNKWRYSWGYEYFFLQSEKILNKYWVMYDYDRRRWFVTGIWPIQLPPPLSVKQPDLKKRPILGKELFQNKIREIERRIAREPKNPIHYSAKVSLLYYNGHLKEARWVCEEALQAIPQHWWPRMMLGYIEDKLGFGNEALEKFEKWADAHPSYENYYYLHILLRAIGKNEKALAPLEKAVTYPIELNDYVFVRPNAFPMNVVYYAYDHKLFRIVIKSCATWKIEKIESYIYFGAYQYEAASHLAVGNVEKAKSVVEENGVQNCDDKLLKAIEAENTGFILSLERHTFREEIQLLADFAKE